MFLLDIRFRSADSTYSLGSTEFITFNLDNEQLEITDGPSMPYSVQTHCFVKLNEEKGLLSGGKTSEYLNDYLALTVIYDIGNQEWTIQYTNLNHRRRYHGCGAVKDSGSQKVLAVFAGGLGVEYELDVGLKTTEVWSLDNPGWTLSADLPLKLSRPASIATPDQLAFLIIGGLMSDAVLSRDIFRFTCFNSDCQWELMDIQLRQGRMAMVAMFVPQFFADPCHMIDMVDTR